MFRPLLPADVIHRILEVDVAGRELLSEVDAWAESTKISWDHSPSVEVVDVDTGEGGRYIVGFGGSATVMPVYSRFVTEWESHGRTNPFDVDWTRADMRELDAVGYVSGVLRIMRRLILVWEADATTGRCDAFRYLDEFVAMLERLLQHSISMHTLRTAVVGGLVAAAA